MKFERDRSWGTIGWKRRKRNDDQDTFFLISRSIRPLENTRESRRTPSSILFTGCFRMFVPNFATIRSNKHEQFYLIALILVDGHDAGGTIKITFSSVSLRSSVIPFDSIVRAVNSSVVFVIWFRILPRILDDLFRLLRLNHFFLQRDQRILETGVRSLIHRECLLSYSGSYNFVKIILKNFCIIVSGI